MGAAVSGPANWIRRLAGLAAAAALALAAAAGGARAQAAGLTGPELEARGGLSLGADGMGALSGPGWTAGAGAAWWVTPHLGVRADGDFDRYSSADDFGPLQEEGPVVRVLHASLGLDYRLVSPERPRLGSIVGLGAGLAFFDTDPFRVPDGGATRTTAFSETFLAPYARGRIFWDLGRGVRVWVDGRARLILADDDTTRIFEVATAGRVPAFEAAWTFPVTAGFSFNLGL